MNEESVYHAAAFWANCGQVRQFCNYKNKTGVAAFAITGQVNVLKFQHVGLVEAGARFVPANDHIAVPGKELFGMDIVEQSPSRRKEPQHTA